MSGPGGRAADIARVRRPHALPTSISAWSGLPVSERITAALVAPVSTGSVVSGSTRSELRSRVQDTLVALSNDPARAMPARITPFSLRRIHSGRPVDPFRWSPWTARRTIGVAAARRCVTNPSRAPALEVAATVAELAGGAAGPGTLGTWLADLSDPVTAVTIAEATTWATNLLDALDWSRPDLHPVVAAADRWWQAPGRLRIGIRGRVDVSVAAAAAAAGHESCPQPRAALTMFDGSPGPLSSVELGLGPLVATLSGPPDAIPARVAGWWPACGRLVVLPVDRGLLLRTADAVVTCLGGRPEERDDPTPAGADGGTRPEGAMPGDGPPAREAPARR
ncbi:MAG: hypothetical protein ACYDHU_03625 [Acidimicrobiales bacterium]